jgi:hypothetical protein
MRFPPQERLKRPLLVVNRWLGEFELRFSDFRTAREPAWLFWTRPLYNLLIIVSLWITTAKALGAHLLRLNRLRALDSPGVFI